MPGFFSSLVTVVHSSKGEMVTPPVIQRSDPVERELVTSLVKISKGGHADLRQAESIVDNTKLLIERHAETIKFLSLEITSLYTQITQLKESVEKIASQQDEYDDNVASLQDDYKSLAASKLAMTQDDKNECDAYNTMMCVLPIIIGLVIAVFVTAYVNLIN